MLVVALFALADPVIEYRQATRAGERLLRVAGEVATRLDDGADPDEVADAIGASAATRVVIVDEAHHIVGDTGGEAARRPDAFVDALMARDPIETEHTALTVQGAEWVVAIVHASQGRTVYAARPAALVYAERDNMRELIVIASVIAFLLTLLLATAVVRRFARPIEELTRAADALADGNLTVRVRSQRTDELGRLGRSVDRMADQLEERLAAVRAEGARLRVVLDGMVEAVFVTDRNGHIVMTNRAIETLLGREVRGRTVVEAVRSTELLETVWAALEGERSQVEFAATVGDEERTLVAQVSPLPEQAGVVAVLHDVTDLKRADRVRRDFVANASHELRTPLTAIRGFAETLRDGAARDPDTAKRFLDTILKHSSRLQRIVNDLLALSRAESADERVALKAIDVVEIASGVVSGLEAPAAAQQMKIVLEAPAERRPLALADEWGLDQVLVNLVDNALKYGKKGGQVTVRVREDDANVWLEVADDGPGIPAKYLERIFERFYRVDKGRSREVGGTGLGLAIVKHLVHGMGAEITVASKVGEGTTFKVRMNRAPANEQTDDTSVDAIV